jgi:hypothetical protein
VNTPDVLSVYSAETSEEQIEGKKRERAEKATTHESSSEIL